MSAQISAAVSAVNAGVMAELKVLRTKLDSTNKRIDNLRHSNCGMIASIFTILALFATVAKVWGH